MSAQLDNVVRCGDVMVAAIATRAVHVGCCRTLSVLGEKRPAAIFIKRGDVTWTFGIDGAPITPDELERRFPGKRAEFERAAAASNPPPLPSAP